MYHTIFKDGDVVELVDPKFSHFKNKERLFTISNGCKYPILVCTKTKTTMMNYDKFIRVRNEKSNKGDSYIIYEYAKKYYKFLYNIYDKEK